MNTTYFPVLTSPLLESLFYEQENSRKTRTTDFSSFIHLELADDWNHPRTVGTGNHSNDRYHCGCDTEKEKNSKTITLND